MGREWGGVLGCGVLGRGGGGRWGREKIYYCVFSPLTPLPTASCLLSPAFFLFSLQMEWGKMTIYMIIMAKLENEI